MTPAGRMQTAGSVIRGWITSGAVNMKTIETDYLIVGAGAAGMAFADALISAGDADMVMVDRKHQPGGHWNDAYPFVKLHQPSAIYGVNSMRLGADGIDAVGTDAGLYERAGAAEICGYFQKVLESVLLPSGRVRFFGMADYTGRSGDGHSFVSRLTGEVTHVRVRRKLVDTTYLQVSVPATHALPFEVDAGARVIPVGDLVHQAGPARGYTILGGGKTAMDACYWLLSGGIDPDRITWIRPRDSWVLPRTSFQPRALMAGTIADFDRGVEALADASDLEDLLCRLEEGGLLQRLDRSVVPTMFRGAIMSSAELEALKSITRVVRKGRIRRIGTNRIVLEKGELATDTRQVHVDCSASGFSSNPELPIYAADRITLQGLVGGFTTFSSALIGFVEASREDDAEKNRLLAPVSPLNAPADWIGAYRGLLRVSALQGGAGGTDLADWLEHARLNLTMGLGQVMQDAAVAAHLGRIGNNTTRAMTNAQHLLGAREA